MTPKIHTADEQLWTLTEAQCDGTISAEDLETLENLLRSSEEARLFYATYMDLHGRLCWRFRGSGRQDTEADISLPSSVPPLVLDLSSPVPSSPFSLQSSLGKYVFSHVAAAVILGIGLLIGLAWRISLPVEGNSGHRSPNIAQAVARITALADCKWTKQGAENRGEGRGERGETQILKSPNPQIPVFLGDRFRLTSGLMQITYDTGAKVLLQGPCTYEIDAIDGGYLAVGKLTALVEKKAEESNLQPLAPSPLFSIRTPTAIVTDLGTEFGVEVASSGATRSHVFQGVIEVRSSNSRRSTNSGELVEILHAGQSIRVERGRNSKVAITRESGQPNHFVRQIPSSFIPHSSSLSQSPRTPDPRSLTPLYRLTDLGTLGGKNSCAYAISAGGQIVGAAEYSKGISHAFLYSNGTMQDLGALPGHKSSIANDINAFGQVVGCSGLRSNRRAFLYSNGAMVDIGTLGGRAAYAMAINDAGQVVGFAQNPQGTWRAFLYTSDQGMQDLGALGGPKANSCATGINALGHVVGYSENDDGQEHAFLYTRETGMKDLGALGGRFSRAVRMNDAGQITGLSDIGRGMCHAFLYSNATGMVDLDARKDRSSRANYINNAGQIVGYFGNGELSHAFLYQRRQIVDLNLLVDPTIGWKLHVASAINNAGHIVGFGKAPDGASRAFLLTPKKEQKTRYKGREVKPGR